VPLISLDSPAISPQGKAQAGHIISGERNPPTCSLYIPLN
jgi:hypothetical protein